MGFNARLVARREVAVHAGQVTGVEDAGLERGCLDWRARRAAGVQANVVVGGAVALKCQGGGSGGGWDRYQMLEDNRYLLYHNTLIGKGQKKK